MRTPERPHRSGDPDLNGAGVGALAFRAMLRSSGRIRRFGEVHIRAFGVTPSQWGVLRALKRIELQGGGPVRLTELCEHLLIQPPGVSGIVDRLVRGRLVSKQGSAADQRAKEIALTDAGRALLAEAQDDHNEWISRLMQGLSRSEQTELLQLLTKLNQHLESLEIPSTGVRASSKPRPTKRNSK